jgi:dephospho-CoA kinase
MQKCASTKNLQLPLRIGITGGIGSGKSTVCSLFETLDVPVYNADVRAKILMSSHPGLVDRIKSLLGEEAYLPDGTINRPYISGLVFRNKDKLAALNAIVHPAVFEDFERWQSGQSKVPYTLKESALLFESGSHKGLHKIIIVTAPLELRIQRVMARDNTSREAVLARMENQWLESDKIKAADFIIRNDGIQPLIPQVLQLHRELLAIAAGFQSG